MSLVRQISDITELQKQGSIIKLPFLVLQIVKSSKFTKVLVTDFTGYSNENKMNSYFIGNHMIMPNEVFPLICFDNSVDRVLANYSRSLNRIIDIDEYNLSFGTRESYFKENYLFVMVEALTKFSSFGFEGKIHSISLIDYQFVKLNKRLVNTLFNNILNVCGIEWAVSEDNDFHEYLQAYKGFIDENKALKKRQYGVDFYPDDDDDDASYLSDSNIEEIIHKHSFINDDIEVPITLDVSKSSRTDEKSINGQFDTIKSLEKDMDYDYADVDDSLYEELEDDAESSEGSIVYRENFNIETKKNYTHSKDIPIYSTNDAMNFDKVEFLDKPIKVCGTNLTIYDGKLSVSASALQSEYFMIRNIHDIDFLIYNNLSQTEIYHLNPISIVFKRRFEVVFINDSQFLEFLGYGSRFSDLIKDKDLVTEQLKQLVSKYKTSALELQVKMCSLPTLSGLLKLQWVYDDPRNLHQLIK